MEKAQSKLVRLEEAAEQLGITAETIRSARKRGTLVLPVVKIAPRVLTFRQSDIDEVIAGNRVIIVTRKTAATQRRAGHEAE